MDTFEIRWSIQKLVRSKAFKAAGEPNEMWNDTHIKWRLIKEKGQSQSIAAFLTEFRTLQYNSQQDIRLRIQFVINGMFLEKMIQHNCYKGSFDLFLEGYISVLEFAESYQQYEQSLFFIQLLLGRHALLKHHNLFDLDNKETNTPLYSCGCCGWDRHCGSWETNISHRNQVIVWKWSYTEEWFLPTFYFEKSQYEATLLEYKTYLEQKLNDLT